MSEPTPDEVPCAPTAPEPLTLELMLPPLPEDSLPALNRLMEENQRLRNRLISGYAVFGLLAVVSALQFGSAWTAGNLLEELRHEKEETKRQAVKNGVKIQQKQQAVEDALFFELRRVGASQKVIDKLEAQIKELNELVGGMRGDLQSLLEDNDHLMQLGQRHHHKNEPPKCLFARPRDPSERRKADEGE